MQYQTSVPRWGVFEVAITGPKDGNPFVDQSIGATFCGAQERKEVEGFYDGDGIYKVRFMPSFTGPYTFRVHSSFSSLEEGSFLVGKEQEGCHGPVRVARKYHFAFEDGTPYYPIGTTCYVWHLQNEKLQEETLKSLKMSPFNKIRFCIFPKHYLFNLHDPIAFPYEGKPVDCSQITPENFKEFKSDFAAHGNHWDFTRFNPSYFQHTEKCIEALGKMGIEADLIVMHPYDRWGFSEMSGEEDDLYWHYVVARFSAYHNVWWSLANEYDLMPAKRGEDWERYAFILCEYDPYRHLRSIHNWKSIYDFSHSWVTHCSVQRIDPYISTEKTDSYREQYGKPVVLDEIVYEGNIKENWGNISARELTRRFWEAAVRGGYPGHGETIDVGDDIYWWSHGGVLHGESPARIAFLRKILEETPMGTGLVRIPKQGAGVMATSDLPGAILGGVQSYYLVYYGFNRPNLAEFYFDEETEFHIQVIDTWEMTITEKGIGKGNFSVPLPGKEYMAIRLIKVEK